MDLLTSNTVMLLLTASVGVAVVLFALERRRRERRDAGALAAAVARNLHEPPSLHPVIDPDICIGSLSCISACPEGDILGIVDGSARLISGANCIGHGKCASECPVDAIKLVFGTSERGVDLPEIDETFESSRAGVYIVGELGGMGLIRNAMTQGIQAAAAIGERLGTAGGSEVVDVAVVGAGPAGIATALGLRHAGKSFRVLEQGSVGGTVAQYPRHKVVMSETLTLPIHGRFGQATISKEDLLEEFGKIRKKAKIDVEENTRVLGIDGEDGRFSVRTSKGVVEARKVVLAVGRRGSPRKLGVPGEELTKVTSLLLEPEQYEACDVLVVGGGDSALEAAMQLSEAHARVTIACRGPAFGPCREANRSRAEQFASEKKLRILYSSTVSSITSNAAMLNTPAGPETIPNDAVITCLGGEVPATFLKSVGIDMRRHFGTARGAPVKLTPGVQKRSIKDEEEAKQRRLAWTLGIIGAAIIAMLIWEGGEYYFLSARDRVHAADHIWLRPAGTWGHGIGIVATLFMLLNFAYAVRKRWRLLKGSAPIRSWLTFHMFVGFMSPLVIAFHAAFQTRNVVATATGISLVIVVITGVIGRFIYGLVPTRGGVALQLGEVLAQMERDEKEAGSLIGRARDPEALRALVARAGAAGKGRLVTAILIGMPADWIALHLGLFRNRHQFENPSDFKEFRTDLLELARLHRQASFFSAFKGMLRGWRAFHAVLAGLLVVMISAHIAVSLYLGYTWIFH